LRNRSLRVASLKRVNENSEAKEKEKKRKKIRKEKEKGRRRRGRRGRRWYTFAKVDSMFCLAFNVCGISNSYKSRKVSG